MKRLTAFLIIVSTICVLSGCASVQNPTPSGTLEYYRDSETGKCFAVIYRDNGNGIAMAEVRCEDIPEDVLLEATRE